MEPAVISNPDEAVGMGYLALVFVVSFNLSAWNIMLLLLGFPSRPDSKGMADDAEAAGLQRGILLLPPLASTEDSWHTVTGKATCQWRKAAQPCSAKGNASFAQSLCIDAVLRLQSANAGWTPFAMHCGSQGTLK